MGAGGAGVPAGRPNGSGTGRDGAAGTGAGASAGGGSGGRDGKEKEREGGAWGRYTQRVAALLSRPGCVATSCNCYRNTTDRAAGDAPLSRARE